MKILVFSDSHTDVETMYLTAERESPDMIFHLGDHLGDAELLCSMLPEFPMLTVPGNCDLSHGAPSVLEKELCGKRIMLTHGHAFSVKNGLTRLYEYGKGLGAEIILFGHTHIPHFETRGGIMLANPGRIGRGAVRGEPPAYGVLTLKGGASGWEHFAL